VIGLACAWRCAAEGLDVAVVDDSGSRGASWAAAGMLAPVTELHYGEEELLALNLLSADRYPAFVSELEDQTEIDVGYRRTGTLIVARDADDYTALVDLHAFQRKLGLEAERLSAADCRTLLPGVSPRTRGGIFVAGDHQVDNRALLEALRRACDRSGVHLLADRVVGVENDGARVVGVATERNGIVGATAVVIAAGSWTHQIQFPAGVAPPIRPVKGQLLHLRGPQPVAAHNVRGLDVYLVPRADGRLVVGATMEEQGMDLRVTAEAVYLLLRDAYEILPGILELDLMEHAVGLRPATPDNAPAIGHSGIDGLLFATGHFRNGVLLAPITAEAIAAMITSDRVPDSVAAFSPQRFSDMKERVR